MLDLGLTENTLVVFASDNGGYLNDPAGGFENISSNGPLKGQKGSVDEGGHRVPGIFFWPGTIRGGPVTAETMLTMDLYPTFARSFTTSTTTWAKPPTWPMRTWSWGPGTAG